MRRLGVLLAILGGCGGGGLDLSGYQDAAIAARCSYLVRCGLFPDETSCEAAFVTLDNPSVETAVDMGKTHYDADAAQTCFDALAAASCDATAMSSRVLPDACTKIFTGTGQEGDACAFDAECASARCSVPACGMACCQGTCAPAIGPAGVGQSCAGVPCAGGSYCDASRICQALVAAGGSCDDSSACDYGLGCVGVTATGPGTCQALPTIGQPCPDGACAEIGAICDRTGTCVAAGLPGDACSGSADCSYYFTCDATMHCAPYPTRGMTCTQKCSDDSWCNVPQGSTTGTCDAPLADGTTCLTNDQCQTHYCDRSGGTPTGTCGPVPVCT